MKNALLLTVVAVVCCSGCDSKKESVPESTGENAIAPMQYLKNAAQAKHSADKTLDTLALNNAIQLFGGEVGRYPTNLNELVDKKYLAEIPKPPHGMSIQYDAASGSVKISKE